MINPALRYFDFGQRAYADAVQFNSICFSCAARLAQIQAGAVSAVFAASANPAGFWLPHGPATRSDGNGAGMAALMKCVDETCATLADAQSQMRAIVESRWSEMASEMNAGARQLAGDDPGPGAAVDRSPRTRANARQDEGRAAAAARAA